MWVRVKGKTENALLRLPFKAAYMFRPGAIQPLHSVRSKAAVSRVIYSLTKPLSPLLESKDISAIAPAGDQSDVVPRARLKKSGPRRTAPPSDVRRRRDDA